MLQLRHAYDDRWHAPTTVAASGAGVVSIEYDALTGNPLWQQQGDASRRVYFDYNTSGPGVGMLARVRYPDPETGAIGGGGADSIAYDALGNVNMTRTPKGFLTLVYRDALGRDTLTITPTDSASARSVGDLPDRRVRQRTEYDAMGRVWKTQATGPAMAFFLFCATGSRG